MASKTKGRPQSGSKRKRYSVEFKLKAVKLYTEEGYSTEMVARELGIGKNTLSTWTKRFREEGVAGLENRAPVPVSRRQIDPAVKEKAVELKKADPKRGSRRIAHLLERFHLMKASPETVRRTLKDAELIERPKTKPQRNPAKPRFFERSRPNQMWQTDIFCFRLGGRNAYLIGYIDDYSRYITGLGLYRSQTAEYVLETLRRAVAEYGVPKEMLTDNGRQYTNWRGTSRFEAELKKDRIAHIKSRPHHPMTLGKIERFWKSIYGEFLARVQFDSFEEAQQRLALWVKYYNYKRPHQGIGGLCPADRFFEIQTQLRQVIERGVEENVLESALRGMPQTPFYMVGRMGDQSVVIRAEKGKVKMLVDGEESGEAKEMIYHVNEQQSEEERNEGSEAGVCGPREMRSGAGDLERTEETGGGVPGDGYPVAAAGELADDGDEGDGSIARTPAHAGWTAPCAAESPDGETARESGCGGDAAEPGRDPASLDPASGGSEEEQDRRELAERLALLDPEEVAIVLELLEPGRKHEQLESDRTAEGGDDPQSSRRPAECSGGGAETGDQPKNLLQVGAAGACCDDGKPLRAELGAAARRAGWGERDDEVPYPGTGE